MRNVVALAVAVIVALSAIPAFAEDGDVPQATLSELGFGGAEVVSDAEGMQVRGLSSFVEVSGASLLFGQLFDSFSHNFVAASSGDWYRAMAENAGSHVMSCVNGSQGSAIMFELDIQSMGYDFHGMFAGAAGDAAFPGVAGFAHASGD